MKNINEIYKLAIKSETAKKHNIKNEPDFIQVKNIEYFYKNLLVKLEEKYKENLVINSWFRNEELNKLVGGSEKSRHKKGMAVDFYVKNKDIVTIFDEIRKSDLKFYKMIVYPKHNFIHLSLDFEENNRKLYYTLDKKHYKRADGVSK